MRTTTIVRHPAAIAKRAAAMRRALQLVEAPLYGRVPA